MIKKANIALVLTVGMSLLGSVNLMAAGGLEGKREEGAGGKKRPGEEAVIGGGFIKIPESKLKEIEKLPEGKRKEARERLEREYRQEAMSRQGKVDAPSSLSGEVKSTGQVKELSAATQKELDQIAALHQYDQPTVDKYYPADKFPDLNKKFSDALSRLEDRLIRVEKLSVTEARKRAQEYLEMVKATPQILEQVGKGGEAKSASDKAAAKVDEHADKAGAGRSSSTDVDLAHMRAALERMEADIIGRGDLDEVAAFMALKSSGEDALRGALKINEVYEAALKEAKGDEVAARKATREWLDKLVKEGVLDKEDVNELCGPADMKAALEAAKAAAASGKKPCISKRQCRV